MHQCADRIYTFQISPGSPGGEKTYHFVWVRSMFLKKAEVSVRVHHMFSVEIDEFKRRFILDAHRGDPDSSFHLFSDVSMFDNVDGMHYCFACECEHKMEIDCDLLVSGPSCKNKSKMFQDRASYSDCFSAKITRFLVIGVQ